MNDDDLLKEGKEKFREIANREDHNRNQYVEATKFYNSEQWPEYLLRQRQNNPDGARPCLTINVLPHYVKQVTNEMRMNRPSIKVLPVDDGADTETAKVFQGVIRHIEQCSDADVVYSTAGKTGVIGGIGYWRILSDYIDQEYGYQELYLKRITNPMTVYFGPCDCPAGSDVMDVFITTLINRKQFAKDYPDQPEMEWDANSQGDVEWYQDQEIRLAEWFHVEQIKHKAVRLQDGKRMKVSDLKDGSKVNSDTEITERTVQWRKMTGSSILKQQKLDGKYIPVVRYIGQEVEVEGKKYFYGLVRDAMDSQRMRNYWRSCETEMIALAPKAPFIGPVGAFDGFEADWAAANTSNKPYLEYNALGADGQPIAPPQRQPGASIPSAMMQSTANADMDIKASTGLFGPSLGEQSNETSGKAIMARQREGDTSTFDYQDNLAVSIRHTGRILVDLIPKTYDVARVQRILGEDGEAQHVQLDPNLPGPRADSPDQAIDGIYNLGVGRYDVTITTGPSFTTKRQEAAESMAQILQGNPELWKVAGDLFAKNLDWPGADVLADRLKKTIPPQLMGDDEKQQESNPQDQAMIQQLDQTIQAMTQHVEQLQQLAEQATQKQQAMETDRGIEQKRVDIEEKRLALDTYKAETERMAMIGKTPQILEIMKSVGQLPEVFEEPSEELEDWEGQSRGMPQGELVPPQEIPMQ